MNRNQPLTTFELDRKKYEDEATRKSRDNVYNKAAFDAEQKNLREQQEEHERVKEAEFQSANTGGYKKRSNKKGSNKKRSNKKRSNKKRSNKKR